MTYSSLYFRFSKTISSSSCFFCFPLNFIWDRDSVVVIETCMGLTVRGSIPGEGRDFPHPALEPTVSYTMGTGSFPEVKRSGRGVNHPHHLAPRLKKE